MKIKQPIKWGTPNFIINWEDYFGVSNYKPVKKPNDYWNKVKNSLK